MNEHYWIGETGRLLLALAFVSALCATVSYAVSTARRDQPLLQTGWLRLARTAFIVHSLSVVGAVALIFTMMLNRWFEYSYVAEHVNQNLEFRYLFSAFWEGQEGSFLLWMFWHVVLGLVLLFRKGDWESPVMAVFAGVQMFLSSMVLGYYIGSGDARIGSSPFVLLKELNEISVPDYIEIIRQRARGLNPLLQNYWMTIHPPTLFLGFASTLVPFAYAIAGLWTRRYREWLQPSMPWALFSGAILGTGIVMGGAWAYEALSFGGYWAWDPVENASLVPWLLLIAGIHCALIARNTGRSLLGVFGFYLASFLLVVYSTFLTRSGVLGDTSVHAFTQMGLEWQLVLFLAAGIGLSLYFVFSRKKEIPSPEGEESIYSREFWMFMGSLVLLFSAILITFTTSVPVYDKIRQVLFDATGWSAIEARWSPPQDAVAHHNRFQIWIALLIGALSGFAQFLRYKVDADRANTRRFWQRGVLPAALLSLVCTVAAVLLTGIWEPKYWQFWMLLFTGGFAFWGNADYLFSFLRNNLRTAGAALSHLGFGLLMWGVFFSGALKESISTGFYAEKIDNVNRQNNEFVTLYKGLPLPMKEFYDAAGVKTGWYEACYLSDKVENNRTQTYEVRFQRKDAEGKVVETFHLHPHIMFEMAAEGPKMTAKNPSTKHYLGRDIFCTAQPDWTWLGPFQQQQLRDSVAWSTHKLAKYDTIPNARYRVVFEGFQLPTTNSDYLKSAEAGDIAVGAKLKVIAVATDSVWRVEPVYVLRGDAQLNVPVFVPELGLELRFPKLYPQEDKAEFSIGESPAPAILLEAIHFPGINLVWLGKILLMGGLALSIFRYVGGKARSATVSGR